MLPFFLLALAQGQIDATQPIEGAWVGAKGGLLVAGHGRIDWQDGDRFCSATVAKDASGALVGRYVGGKGLWNRLQPLRTWSEHPQYDYDPPHLLPDGDETEGDARVATTKEGLRFAFRPKGGGWIVESFVRGTALTELSLAGRYVGGETTVVVEDALGFGGEVRGTIVHQGKTLRFAGLRLLGRAGIATFDPAKSGEPGTGYLAWVPAVGGKGKVGALVASFTVAGAEVRAPVRRLGI